MSSQKNHPGKFVGAAGVPTALVKRSNSTTAKPAVSHAEKDLVGRGIKQWRAERPDIDSSGKAVVGRILRLEEVVLRTFNAVLQPLGIKYQAYAVLATLRVAGRPYRLSPSRLQSTLLFTSGGLSNLLRRLENDGLIRRSIDPIDRRGVSVQLTAKGLLLADEAMPAHAAAERQLLRMFDARQCAMLAELLSMMMVANAPELGTVPDISED